MYEIDHVHICTYVYVCHSCRHEVIAKYFGDPKPACNKSCDYCKNPLATKENCRSMKLCQAGKRQSVGSQMAYFEYGEPDYSLYGGGRWGYKE